MRARRRARYSASRCATTRCWPSGVAAALLLHVAAMHVPFTAARARARAARQRRADRPAAAGALAARRHGAAQARLAVAPARTRTVDSSHETNRRPTTMSNVQPGILEPVPRVARYLTFVLAPVAGADAASALSRLQQIVDAQATVVGIGRATSLALGREVPGLRDFTARSGPAIDIPSTPAALWCWLRGDDRGELGAPLARAWLRRCRRRSCSRRPSTRSSTSRRPRPHRLRGRHREPAGRGGRGGRRASQWARAGTRWLRASSPCSAGCTTSTASPRMCRERAGRDDRPAPRRQRGTRRCAARRRT